MKGPIRVYLLSPRELALAPIRAALEEAEGLVCAGSAKSAEEAVRELEELPADVVVLEAGDEPRRALRQLGDLAGALPRWKLLPLGLTGPREVLAFLEAGAGGYVLKSEPWSRVVEAIEEVFRGEVRCEPRIAAMVCTRIAELARGTGRARPRQAGPRQAGPRQAGPRHTPAPEELSAREAQVLRLLAGGLQNKEIARRLGIALSTAAHHVQKILVKLKVHGRRDAVRRACEQDLVDCRMLWPATGPA